MTSEELLEKMARAISSEDGSDEDAVFSGVPWWTFFLPEARAVLAVVREAMREPSEEMLDADSTINKMLAASGDHHE